jgi:hypothetical protein
MSDKSSNEGNVPEAGNEVIGRRLFLQSLGKWSGAAIAAVVAGSWLASAPNAQAGGWVNRRCGGGGSWANRYGGGGGWVNRYGGGGTGWINHYGGGGGAWVNRW